MEGLLYFYLLCFCFLPQQPQGRNILEQPHNVSVDLTPGIISVLRENSPFFP